jgi:ubiquinone/menaquinone biosynthesis C-methylase UbiE/uncharacterized protein YbaR (Trm112 family)
VVSIKIKNQSIESQKGEISFRKKLVEQQLLHEENIDGELSKDEIEKALNERMETTLEIMEQLKKRKIKLSPYLEIGAERGQRSLIMENEIEAKGAAVDLSFDMLKTCDYYQNLFKKKNAPVRVCCDANNLPFLSNSIPFIFSYQFLHHFPDPSPIIKEIYRVISSDGFYYFSDEPYKQVAHLNLYTSKHANEKNYKPNKIQNFFNFFFAKRYCNELEYNIVENHDISLKLWKKSLQIFEEKEVQLSCMQKYKESLYKPKSLMKYFLCKLIGGNITGLCQKTQKLQTTTTQKSILENIICPSCKINGDEILLNNNPSSFNCPKCSNKYPIVENVIFLLIPSKMTELYPNISEDGRKS